MTGAQRQTLTPVRSLNGQRVHVGANGKQTTIWRTRILLSLSSGITPILIASCTCSPHDEYARGG
jgi:hypothetical protein